MKCPECGHEARPGASECSQCPCIFPEERTRASGDLASMRRGSPLVQFAVAVIGLSLVVFAVIAYKKERKKIEARRHAAEMRTTFSQERLEAGLKGLEDPIAGMSKKLKKLTKKVQELEQRRAAEQITPDKFYVTNPNFSEEEDEPEEAGGDEDPEDEE